jgi:hypothetical protein
MEQMERRGISLASALLILENPDEVIQTDNYIVYQSVVAEDSQSYLTRIFVNDLKSPKVVITAYKTSKITKYHDRKI